MTISEWEDVEQSYIDAETPTTFSHGLLHYYVCEEEPEEMKCFVDVYKGGYYYTIDLSVLDSDKDETMAFATVISASVLKEPEQKPDTFVCIPGVFLALFTGFAICKK